MCLISKETKNCLIDKKQTKQKKQEY